MNKENQIVIYKTKNGETEIDVKMQNETLWLTQKSMAELFGCSADNVGLHLKNIFKEQELNKDLTTENFSVVQKEGTRQVKRTQTFYNLDAIISVGYRVNSTKATQFRIWATKILKKYLVESYAINKNLLEKQKEKFATLLVGRNFIRLWKKKQQCCYIWL